MSSALFSVAVRGARYAVRMACLCSIVTERRRCVSITIMPPEKCAVCSARNVTKESAVSMTTLTSYEMQSNTLVEVGPPDRGVHIKARLLQLGKQAADLILSSGILLREYRSGAYYKEDGHASFDVAIEAWKDAGLIDYGARQARHLIAVVDMCESLNIEGPEVNKLGISKLREIASIKDPQQQLALLGQAGQKSYSEVQAEAKRIRDKAAGRDTDPLDPVTLLMSVTQKAFYKEAIGRGRQLSGLGEDKVPDVAVLVDVILADWMSGAADVNTETGEVANG